MKKTYLKNWLKKLILHNTGWKILSLLIAIFLWFLVMNLLNPTEVKTYNVGLTLLNKDKLESNDFVILNEEELSHQKVEIKVKGSRTALDALNKKENRENIKANVDLSQFELLYAKDVEEVVKVGVTPSLPSNLYSYTYQIVSYSPPFIEIKLDNVSEHVMPITIETIGNAASGYISSLPEVNPSEISVIGAESELAKIDSVKVILDLANSTKNIEKSLTPAILDKDGNKLSKLKLSQENVMVTVSINKQGQVIINNPEIAGSPADGFFIESVDYEPKFIEVLGDESGFSKLPEIELPEINVEGIAENKNVVFDIRPYLKGTGLYLKDSSKNEIYVTVKLGKESSRVIKIPSSNISVTSLSNDLQVSLEDTQLNISGDENLITTLDESTIKVSVDLSGLGVGSHTIEATAELPDGIKANDKCYVTVDITKDNEEASAEQTTTSNETENTNNNENSNEENENIE